MDRWRAEEISGMAGLEIIYEFIYCYLHLLHGLIRETKLNQKGKALCHHCFPFTDREANFIWKVCQSNFTLKLVFIHIRLLNVGCCLGWEEPTPEEDETLAWA
jgi:hypothetical protein